MTQHAVHHATVGDLLWPTLNFVIFVAVLVHFLRAPAVEYFRARTARLREALQTGARARAEAQALLALGRAAAERIRTDARLLAEHEFAAARAALRFEVIEEAVRQATALIRQAIRPEDQERFVREFVTGAGAPA